MENDYMLIRYRRDAYRIGLLARKESGCILNYGSGSLALDDYDERMWVYWLYVRESPKDVAYYMQERCGNGLTGEDINRAIDKFKSKHYPLKLETAFNYSNIPLYGDEENGLALHIQGHVCIISLDEERELLEIIASDPTYDSVIRNMKTWFSQYCKRGRYAFLKSCSREQVMMLYDDFLVQHGMAYWEFDATPKPKKISAVEDWERIEKTKIESQQNNENKKSAVMALVMILLGFIIIAGTVGIVDNVHTGSLDADGTIMFFVLTFGFFIAAVCFAIADGDKDNKNR